MSAEACPPGLSIAALRAKVDPLRFPEAAKSWNDWLDGVLATFSIPDEQGATPAVARGHLSLVAPSDAARARRDRQVALGTAYVNWLAASALGILDATTDPRRLRRLSTMQGLVQIPHITLLSAGDALDGPLLSPDATATALIVYLLARSEDPQAVVAAALDAADELHVLEAPTPRGVPRC